jgi:hypothetical protein
MPDVKMKRRTEVILLMMFLLVIASLFLVKFSATGMSISALTRQESTNLALFGVMMFTFTLILVFLIYRGGEQSFAERFLNEEKMQEDYSGIDYAYKRPSIAQMQNVLSYLKMDEREKALHYNAPSKEIIAFVLDYAYRTFPDAEGKTYEKKPSEGINADDILLLEKLTKRFEGIAA